MKLDIDYAIGILAAMERMMTLPGMLIQATLSKITTQNRPNMDTIA